MICLKNYLKPVENKMIKMQRSQIIKDIKKIQPKRAESKCAQCTD